MGMFLGGLGHGAGGFVDTSGPSGQGAHGGPTTQALSGEVRDLTHQVQRLSLLNQALWEMLRDQFNLDEQVLAAKIKEIDLRDGVEDGRVTDTAVQCPQCNRVSNSKHYRCLYCGIEFQRPIMG